MAVALAMNALWQSLCRWLLIRVNIRKHANRKPEAHITAMFVWFAESGKKKLYKFTHLFNIQQCNQHISFCKKVCTTWQRHVICWEKNVQKYFFNNLRTIILFYKFNKSSWISKTFLLKEPYFKQIIWPNLITSSLIGKHFCSCGLHLSLLMLIKSFKFQIFKLYKHK